MLYSYYVRNERVLMILKQRHLILCVFVGTSYACKHKCTYSMVLFMVTSFSAEAAYPSMCSSA